MITSNTVSHDWAGLKQNKDPGIINPELTSCRRLLFMLVLYQQRTVGLVLYESLFGYGVSLQYCVWNVPGTAVHMYERTNNTIYGGQY